MLLLQEDSPEAKDGALSLDFCPVDAFAAVPSHLLYIPPRELLGAGGRQTSGLQVPVPWQPFLRVAGSLLGSSLSARSQRPNGKTVPGPWDSLPVQPRAEPAPPVARLSEHHTGEQCPDLRTVLPRVRLQHG